MKMGHIVILSMHHPYETTTQHGHVGNRPSPIDDSRALQMTTGPCRAGLQRRPSTIESGGLEGGGVESGLLKMGI